MASATARSLAPRDRKPSAGVRGLLITGTDTGAGKTILGAALAAAMVAAGERVSAHKPVLTGLDESGLDGWPPDHELLAAAAGVHAEVVAPLRYGVAASPQLAAELAGERIEPARLIAAARAAGGEHTLIVEGVGGLLTPFAERFTVRELAAALALPVLIAARPGLGTINHTLLTLEAARAVSLDVRAVVFTPWPQRPSLLERSNRETVARVGAVAVAGLGRVRAPEPPELARAGARLPWREWLAAPAARELLRTA
jgi:dethiobiotin synthetase